MSGHGASGGFGTKPIGKMPNPEDFVDIVRIGNLDEVTKKEPKGLIKDILTEDGVIYLLCCEQAKDETVQKHVQDLANFFGVAVIANSGCVSQGTYGEGTWYKFPPKTKNN